MIGYFVKAGDLKIGQIFNQYRFAFSSMLDDRLAGKVYSKDLKLILIEYHVEGRFLKLPFKEHEVKPYRKNERSIAVVVGVPNEFSSWPDIEKKRYIVGTTLSAIADIKDELSKRSAFDLEGIAELYTDIENCSRAYLETQL